MSQKFHQENVTWTRQVHHENVKSLPEYKKELHIQGKTPDTSTNNLLEASSCEGIVTKHDSSISLSLLTQPTVMNFFKYLIIFTLLRIKSETKITPTTNSNYFSNDRQTIQ